MNNAIESARVSLARWHDDGDNGGFYHAEDVLREAGLIPADHPLGCWRLDGDKVVLYPSTIAQAIVALKSAGFVDPAKPEHVFPVQTVDQWLDELRQLEWPDDDDDFLDYSAAMRALLQASLAGCGEQLVK